MNSYNGIGTSLSDLMLTSKAKSRSISCENLTGEPGRGGMCELEDGIAKHAAQDLGKGWKVNPYTVLKPGETFTLADIEGPGCIQHIWMTVSQHWRNGILRIYWDGQQRPAVECPVGDFFACGWGEYAQVSALPVNVNPGSAFNCYWQMPFRKRCLITLENRNRPSDQHEGMMSLYYQVDYCLTEIPDNAAYFHAQFRRVNPLPYKEVYTILDGIEGPGQYVGLYMAWGVNNSGWWGEGEIKFFIDDDEEYPTICGTGTEDYFCGSYNFENRKTKRYQEFTTPYAGVPQVLEPDGVYRSQQRFGMYRFHVADPIRFEKKLRVNIQALGWRSDRRYLPLQDDIASVAYWYQSAPTTQFPALPDADDMEII